MALEHICKRVGKKDWDGLLAMWINFLPRINFPITREPDPTSSIDRLKIIKAEIDQNERLTTNREHYFVIEGIHNLIFEESVYLFYKALNVLRSTQCELVGGFKTWSIANAYQSSYFFLKCLLNLLGVHIARIDSKDLLIDLLPEYRGLKKSEIMNRRLVHECQVQITKQLEHWEMWTLFQRVLTVSQCSVLKDDMVSFLSRIAPKDFARQRNRIIYYNTTWLFDDLKECIIDPDFAIRRISLEDDLTADDDFSLIVSFTLLKTSYELLNEIAMISGRFQVEIEIANQIMSQGHNERYQNFLALQDLTH